MKLKGRITPHKWEANQFFEYHDMPEQIETTNVNEKSGLGFPNLVACYAILNFITELNS